MMLRICVCCGEPIQEKGNALSRNPNLCASCSSLCDGMNESDASAPVSPEQNQLPLSEKSAETRQAA